MKFIRGKVKPETKSQGWASFAITTALCTFSFVWLLAVVKVFLLDRRSSADSLVITEVVSQNSRTELFSGSSNEPVVSSGSDSSNKIDIPSSSEWEFIRSNPKKHTDSLAERPLFGMKHHSLDIPKKDIKDSKVDRIPASVTDSKPAFKAPHELTWPPLLADGSIPPGEGSELMPLTGIKVPLFWEPQPGTDIFKSGSYINGQETIFLMIASYRDFQCRETITSAFRKSDHPERLFVGAVDQTVPGDTGCLDIDIPCSQDPSQPICKYRDQISVYHMDAVFATGPVTARHVGDRMYRGQYFVMQMDAHCLFVNHWDTQIISQWKQTHNEMAVLSSYLTDIQGSIDANGDSTRDSRPLMCNSDFEGLMPARYLRHGSQPEEVAVIRDMPQLQPFWAAGFSFSRGHFKVQVPYDGYQPMVFQGEEIAIGIRGFTFGYDFYAPRDSVVFHEYAERSSRRKKVHMFWENSKAHAGEGQKSLRRSTAIIGMAPDIQPDTWDHTEEARYGLGKERELSEFYRLFLIDPYARKAVQLCPFVRSGKMHREFQKYLRSDGRGIDYSFLKSFDTAAQMGLKK